MPGGPARDQQKIPAAKRTTLTSKSARSSSRTLIGHPEPLALNTSVAIDVTNLTASRQAVSTPAEVRTDVVIAVLKVVTNIENRNESQCRIQVKVQRIEARKFAKPVFV